MSISSPLSAMQLAALRKCSRICFTNHGKDGMIRAIKDVVATDADPFAAEGCNEIEVATLWDDYASPHVSFYGMEGFRGFEMLYNWEKSAWRTIAGLLKVGDELSLQWQRDAATTPALAAAGFHGDVVSLIVMRGGKRLFFALSTQVAPDNLARMITQVRAKEHSLV